MKQRLLGVLLFFTVCCGLLTQDLHSYEDKAMRSALITGITGQDGFYLAKLLLEKGYMVYGLCRPVVERNMTRLEPLQVQYHDQFQIVSGDVTDPVVMGQIIGRIRPDEIYNLAAQSFVGISFEIPVATAHVDGLGFLHILEAIRGAGLAHSTRIYQASSSELFGKVLETPQSETTPFYPRSPYAVAKAYAYWIGVNYRESYQMFICNGILFNHESPFRGREFVTQKIVQGIAEYMNGSKQPLFLGNLDACRDWGYAPEYVEAMWLMLQQDQPDDYVIATGRTVSVRAFVELVCRHAGISLLWVGQGVDEKGIDTITGATVVAIDSRNFRPAEVDLLCGDASKAKRLLGWQPKTSLEELAQMMLNEALETCRLKYALRALRQMPKGSPIDEVLR